jgi:uncharacterized membrane protein
MRRSRVNTAAFLLGIGLGGLLDAILLQHILQWEQTLAGDGWFYFAMWLAAAVGVVFLFSAFRAPGRMPSGRAFAGFILIGWGAYNLVEGIVDPLILNLHHVRDLPSHMAVYDWAFLALSALVLLIGLSLRDGRDPGPVSDRRSGTDRRLASMLHQ